jgi:eukaryotic-like serine/threonine-protein kinase
MVQSRLPPRYRVIEEVGQGGMAVVYRAHDETLQREVAIKVLHSHLLAEPESKARLEREAQAVAKLHHDNILQVFDYSAGDSLAAYIVTEFIDGQTLKQFFSARANPQPEVAALIAMEIGTALAHAHSLGIIHRDIKPENVMVRRDGVLKLMDFGVAQIVNLERMTITGQLIGSPAYMAPELFEGRPLDFRTDVFSVGVMLYQIATGALPFSGRNPHELLKRIAEARFPDPRTLNRLVADRLSRVISRALAKKPDDRYPTMSAFVEDLKHYVADAGLEDVRGELARFFTDPDGYERDLRPRTVAGLVATGMREQAAGKLARALECWNRALAIEPRNADVLRALHRIEGRRRVHRTLVALGGAALLAGLIWGAFRVARDDVRAPVAPAIAGARDKGAGPARVGARTEVAGPETPAGQAALSPDRKSTAHPLVQARAAAPKPSATRSPSMRQGDSRALAMADRPTIKTFALAPNPLGSEVWLDGKMVRKAVDLGRNTLDVPMDREHVIEFRNDTCCNPYVFHVGPNAPRILGDRLIGPMARKPARLRVTLDPPPLTQPDMDYVVLPAGPGATHVPFKTGEEVSIFFDSQGEMRKKLLVTVYLEGRKVPVTREVEIAPGQDKNVPVHIPSGE